MFLLINDNLIYFVVLEVWAQKVSKVLVCLEKRSKCTVKLFTFFFETVASPWYINDFSLTMTDWD